jgi:hypothetical protein
MIHFKTPTMPIEQCYRKFSDPFFPRDQKPSDQTGFYAGVSFSKKLHGYLPFVASWFRFNNTQ